LETDLRHTFVRSAKKWFLIIKKYKYYVQKLFGKK
jgi:hypothetical protein